MTASEDYRETVDRMAKLVAALQRPDERTKDVYGVCCTEILPRAQALLHLLDATKQKQLEELVDSFCAYEDEGGFIMVEIPGLKSDYPEDIIAHFLELFRKAGE